MTGPNDFIDSQRPDGAVALVPNNDSGNGSTMPSYDCFVTVAANTTDTNDWLVTPDDPVPGLTIRGWSTVAHEIRTPASSGVKINNVDSDGTQEAAIPATTLWKLTYVSATVGYILEANTELGAVVTAIVPD